LTLDQYARALTPKRRIFTDHSCVLHLRSSYSSSSAMTVPTRDLKTPKDWFNQVDSVLSQYGFTDSLCHCCGVSNADLSGLLMQCAKCRKAYYCSSQCFNAHLDVHRTFCNAGPMNCDPSGTKFVPSWRTLLLEETSEEPSKATTPTPKLRRSKSMGRVVQQSSSTNKKTAPTVDRGREKAPTKKSKPKRAKSVGRAVKKDDDNLCEKKEPAKRNMKRSKSMGKLTKSDEKEQDDDSDDDICCKTKKKDTSDWTPRAKRKPKIKRTKKNGEDCAVGREGGGQ